MNVKVRHTSHNNNARCLVIIPAAVQHDSSVCIGWKLEGYASF